MSVLLTDKQSNVICGLGTFTHTAAATSAYAIGIVSMITPPSSLLIVINLNGSPIATLPTPTVSQGILSLEVATQCVPGDIISVVLSSSAPIDMLPNTIKSIIAVGRI